MPELYIPSIYDTCNGAEYLSDAHNDAMLTLFERGQAEGNLQLIYGMMIARDDCDTADRKCKRELKNLDKLIDAEAEVGGDDNDRIRHRHDIAVVRYKYNKYIILFEYRLSELIKIIERDA